MMVTALMMTALMMVTALMMTALMMVTVFMVTAFYYYSAIPCSRADSLRSHVILYE